MCVYLAQTSSTGFVYITKLPPLLSCKCNNWTCNHYSMITDHLITLTPQEKDNLLITVNLSLESKLPRGNLPNALIVFTKPWAAYCEYLLITWRSHLWSVWSPWSSLLLISFEWPQFHCLTGRIQHQIEADSGIPPSIFVYTGLSRSRKDDCLWRLQIGHIPWDSLKF